MRTPSPTAPAPAPPPAGEPTDTFQASAAAPRTFRRAALPTYPHEILIIRHGEKPDSGSGLSPQGEQRAQALADAIPQRYPDIDYLFATAATPESNRPALTLQPLAQKLGKPIDQQFGDNQYGALADTLLHDPQYAGKTILISWHHGKIPELAQALGADPPVSKWPTNTFDRIWQIDYGVDGAATLQDLPQHVLPGDSSS